ncbi:VOC family protein [Chitinophaga qingshengii]|uniref:VOC family protein n=1 Tax=Chitinophaga qingshengii TaxID=1569794 RepID=A0ABR7TRU2_9BACT|nr:VOC family protein [Chitinophaga qingshengii]MBC9933203.1 VOC family protein [Chitinophaga qingshengii]
MANKIITQRITPHLWFANEAEEAAKFYTSIFQHSSIGNITHYTDAGHDIHGMPAGSVLTVDFTLDGQHFIGLNGGPYFKFNEAVSFMVRCANQEEIDYYWEKLREGGDPKADQCGWLKDKFGLSWQVAPVQLEEMLMDKDKDRLSRVMNAIFKMKKIELKAIEEAYRAPVGVK